MTSISLTNTPADDFYTFEERPAADDLVSDVDEVTGARRLNDKASNSSMFQIGILALVLKMFKNNS